MEISTHLKETFEKIRDHLDEMDQVREQILPMQRQIVRWCSEIIKRVHRQEWGDIPENINKAKQNFFQMQELIAHAPGKFQKNYVQIVKQELGEAIILYNLLKNQRLATPEECGITLVDYAYALADVVGELRRFVLKCIRHEAIADAHQALDYMDEIYTELFTLDYPGGLIPGLRKKTDIARRLVTKTESEVTLSANMLKLTKNLERHAQKD